jgi:uncharacterized repeat protein (TIGR01451 family)
VSCHAIHITGVTVLFKPNFKNWVYAVVPILPGQVGKAALRTCPFQSDAAKVTQTITVTVMPPEAPVGTLLTYTVALQLRPQDDNLLDNTGHWIARVGHVPNLLNGTIKTNERSIIHAGGVVTYTIVVTNTSAVSATITITDPIPLGVTYQSGSSSVNGTPLELYDAAANAIQWTGTIATNEAVRLSFGAAITATSGRVRNVAYINNGTWLTFERVAEAVFLELMYLPLVMR